MIDRQNRLRRRPFCVSATVHPRHVGRPRRAGPHAEGNRVSRAAFLAVNHPHDRDSLGRGGNRQGLIAAPARSRKMRAECSRRATGLPEAARHPSIRLMRFQVDLAWA